jgi:hypothetical protein
MPLTIQTTQPKRVLLISLRAMLLTITRRRRTRDGREAKGIHPIATARRYTRPRNARISIRTNETKAGRQTLPSLKRSWHSSTGT